MCGKYCRKLKHAKKQLKSNKVFDIFLVGLVEPFAGLVFWHLPKYPKTKRHLHFLTQVGLVEPARRAIHWMPSMIVERQVIPNFLPIPGWIALVFWAKLLSFFCQVYLGRADQASDSEVIFSRLICDLFTSRWHQAHCEKVIHGLGITHVLSTSRIRASKFRGLVYILVNKVSTDSK